MPTAQTSNSTAKRNVQVDQSRGGVARAEHRAPHRPASQARTRARRAAGGSGLEMDAEAIAQLQIDEQKTPPRGTPLQSPAPVSTQGSRRTATPAGTPLVEQSPRRASSNGVHVYSASPASTPGGPSKMPPSSDVATLQQQVATLQAELSASKGRLQMWEDCMRQLANSVLLSPEMTDMYKTTCVELIHEALSSVESVQHTHAPRKPRAHRTRAHTRARMHARALTHTHACTHARMHARTHARARTRAHTRTHRLQVQRVVYADCSFPSVAAEAPRLALLKWESMDYSEWSVSWKPSWTVQAACSPAQPAAAQPSSRPPPSASKPPLLHTPCLDPPTHPASSPPPPAARSPSKARTT